MELGPRSGYRGSFRRSSMAVFKYYRATETWLTANSFLVSNAIVAAAVPFLLADMVLEAVIPW